jgi:hypothetical protein
MALAGRARWRVENGVFNTMKNTTWATTTAWGKRICQSTMMLAFLLDRRWNSPVGCFRRLASRPPKFLLWERIRSYFHIFRLDSMEALLRIVAFGLEVKTRKTKRYERCTGHGKALIRYVSGDGVVCPDSPTAS